MSGGLPAPKPPAVRAVSLDPALEAQLRAEGTLIPPRLQDMPLAQALQFLRQPKPPQSPPPGQTAITEDRTITGPDGNGIALRLYRPPGEAPLPALLHCHGGGWVGGGIGNDDLRCHITACRAGVIVISVDYRLAPEHKFPAGLEDAYATLLWLHGNARSIGADPDRLGVSGSSAGANLAIGVTFLARERRGPAFKFQLLAYPVCDTSLTQPSHQENAEAPLLSTAMMAWFIAHYLPAGTAVDNALAAPLRATDFRQLPPALIIAAECDPLRDEAAAFAARLREADVPVTHTCYEGMVHGFMTRAPNHPQSQAALTQTIAAIRAFLV